MSNIDKLVIAEKPSLARAIADALGKPQKRDGYIECGNWVVTWCFGHLLEQATPDKYGWTQWRLDALPMLPKEWIFEPRADKQVKAQIKVIKGFLGQAREVVHAGDPDREGQLLVDEILEHLGAKKPVKRIWLSATDSVSVKKALGKLGDNKSCKPLRDAAMARSKADWLVGMNLSRAATLVARKQSGRDKPLPIGRVQTPTLGMVVARDREIENFVPKDYYVPKAKIAHPQGEFTANWLPGDDARGLDEEGRLINKQEADRVCAVASGQQGSLASASEKQKTRKPDLPHMLSTLQKEAYARHKIEPEEVLKLAQALYERGILSYPRTDCRYLPQEQLGEAKRVLASLKGKGLGASGADSSLKSPAWNNSKVGAHHAIVPTGKLEKMGEREWKVFEVAARGYVRQFYPDMRYLEQSAIANIGGERWKATGRIVLERGWTVVDGKKENAEQLPRGMAKGDPVQCPEAWVESKKTSPPARFTKASLLEAMGKVHSFVRNETHKKKLKETSGLGTEATRTGIIESLVKRGLLGHNSSKLISSQSGRALIDSIPESLRDPGMTALWEDALEMVARGDMTEDEFLAKQEKAIASLVNKVSVSDFGAFKGLSEPQGKFGRKAGGNSSSQAKSPGSQAGGKSSQDKQGVKCPECGEKTLVRRKSKKGSWYWGCFNKEKHLDGGPVFRPDNKGKPGGRG